MVKTLIEMSLPHKEVPRFDTNTKSCVQLSANNDSGSRNVSSNHRIPATVHRRLESSAQLWALAPGPYQSFLKFGETISRDELSLIVCDSVCVFVPTYIFLQRRR